MRYYQNVNLPAFKTNRQVTCSPNILLQKPSPSNPAVWLVIQWYLWCHVKCKLEG